MKSLIQGQIVATFRRQYLAELSDGRLLTCLTRSRKNENACGDMVEIQRINELQGVIECTLPRHTLLYRSDSRRQKLIAANISQIVVVVASMPPFSDELLTRCLIAAHDQKLETLIVFNKCDLHQAAQAAHAQLDPYRAIGYRILELSARENPAPLLPFLEGHTSILVGQSGMGKSTIINQLIPGAQAATNEISSALNSGKHTTTHSRLYHLNPHSHLIDCPGIQAFGLHHLDFDAIEAGFVEFAAYQGQCHFHNCRHMHEPNCALKKTEQEGKIHARRLKLFQEISQSRM